MLIGPSARLPESSTMARDPVTPDIAPRTTVGHDQVPPMSGSSRISTPTALAAPSAVTRTALIRRLANPPKKSAAPNMSAPARPKRTVSMAKLWAVDSR